jgi:ribonuclease R
MSRPLIQLLRRHVSGLTLSGIARALRLPPGGQQELKKRLQRLEEAGLLFHLQRRYFASNNVDIREGGLTTTTWGKGFVVPDGGGPYIHIPEGKTGGALHGDRVEVAMKSLGKKKRPEGQVIRIIAEGSGQVIGEYRDTEKGAYLCPINAVETEFRLRSEGKAAVRERLKPGLLILADRHSGCVTEVLGEADDEGVATEVVIRKYLLPTLFSGAEKEAAELQDSLSKDDIRGRTDLRSRRVFTLDSEGARDFDDAVDIEKRPDGYRIGVHISDVSHFVPPFSRLDEEAFRRGTSVYFPDRVLPMFPPRLSFTTASLIPGKDRLALSVFLNVDNEGRVEDREFCLSVIRSRHQLSYPEAGGILKNESGRPVPEEVRTQLFLMRQAARLLRTRRLAAGGLDFDLDSRPYTHFSDDLKQISSEELEAGWIIEDFMIAANEAVALFLEAEGGPLIYRIHPPSPPEVLAGLRGLLSVLGITLPPPGSLSGRDIQAALDKGRGKAAEALITLSVLRSLRRASYSNVREGHFGLGKRIYTHFTSPIRRYPDLIIHRILKKSLRRETIRTELRSGVSQYLTERQKTASDAERDLREWQAYRRLQGKTGMTFPGLIMETGKAGLVVALGGVGDHVEGFLPYAGCGDVFIREREYEVKGRRSGRIFRVGQTLMVTLREVDAVRRRLAIELARG